MARIFLSGCRVRRTNPGLLLLAVCWLAVGVAHGQTAGAEPHDLDFEIVNATTGEPATVERLTVAYFSNRQNVILDYEPEAGSFSVPAVPIKDGGEYIITVLYKEVPYWWSQRGHSLIDQVITLHVFDTSDELAGVSITGLNLVVKQQETIITLEYMLQINNATNPQVTVLGSPTFELAFPTGTAGVEAEYRRGPTPTAIPVTGGRQVGLTVPLTPGNNQISVKAMAPWNENMELPVSSDLPVEAWSLLASPSWLEVQALDLERAGEQEVPGFGRFVGPALEAERRFVLRLASGRTPADQETDLFTQSATGDSVAAATTAPEESGGFTSRLPLVLAVVLAIILGIAVIRRRTG